MVRLDRDIFAEISWILLEGSPTERRCHEWDTIRKRFKLAVRTLRNAKIGVFSWFPKNHIKLRCRFSNVLTQSMFITANERTVALRYIAIRWIGFRSVAGIGS